MVSSSKGSGDSTPPDTPAPAGTTVPYGGTSAAVPWSGSQSVLPNGGPMTTDLMSKAWTSPNWSTPYGPAPPAAGAGGGGAGLGGMDAFAQQLMDYRKNLQMAQFGAALNPSQGIGNYVDMLRNRPAATTPTQKLMSTMFFQPSGGRDALAMAMGGGGGGHMR